MSSACSTGSSRWSPFKLNALRLGDNVSRVFMTVLDTVRLGPVEEDEEVQAVTGRAVLERGSKATLAMTDKMLEIVHQLDASLELSTTSSISAWPDRDSLATSSPSDRRRNLFASRSDCRSPTTCGVSWTPLAWTSWTTTHGGVGIESGSPLAMKRSTLRFSRRCSQEHLRKLPNTAFGALLLGTRALEERGATPPVHAGKRHAGGKLPVERRAAS